MNISDISVIILCHADDVSVTHHLLQQAWKYHAFLLLDFQNLQVSPMTTYQKRGRIAIPCKTFLDHIFTLEVPGVISF